ncbi:MAG: hypothetical protein H7250_01370 [Flavobacterium sp.]|nr:hypothetical protein [Flavobacterium sp.]
MIRTVLTPQNQNISISLPLNFIGKKVEVIAFTIEETQNETPSIDKTLTHFASQEILAKDWLTVEEDLAWKDL